MRFRGHETVSIGSRVRVNDAQVKWLNSTIQSRDRPNESLLIVKDYVRKPNENWFFSVSAKAIKFLMGENRSKRVLAICPQAGAAPRPNVGSMPR